MKKDEIWGPKGAETLADMMVIEDIIQGKVYAYPLFGGRRGSMDLEDFEKSYQHLDRDMVRALSIRFKPTQLVLDDPEDEISIPAFTNGESYSCGVKPFFEKDEILKHIQSGALTDPTRKVWFDEGIGSFVEIFSHDFKNIPEDLDVGNLIEQAQAGGGQYDMDHPELGSLTTVIARKTEFEHQGRTVTLYNVFDGWSWFTKDREPTPEEMASPTP